MKHIFLVNPRAGNGQVLETVKTLVGARSGCEIYNTSDPDNTIDYILHRSKTEPNEELRFVACGGDGTVNTVASGVLQTRNASMSILPLGSGNDYVKAYGGKDAFLNIDSLLSAAAHPVDVIRVNDRYCVNAFHFGLDSAVADTMNKVKQKPIIGGSNAYATGVLKALLCSMRGKCTIHVDGELFHQGDFLLCTATCGEYVGGSYRCAPRTKVDDGQAEICLVKPVSRLRFLRLMNSYKTGCHLTDPRFEKVVQYRRGRVMDVEGSPGFIVSLDGEVVAGTSFHAEVLPGKLRFASVKGPNNGWSEAFSDPQTVWS